MEIGASSSKRQKRILHFTAEEKRKLISAVKENARIWNISDPMHSNKNAVDQAWNRIGVMLEKTVEECKAAWVSLRESYRYRAKVAQKKQKWKCGR
ncbi:PREDICTED: uncharacterized protein LOC108374767 isoform X3 [Rhagoletis zephyria]|uniref:uncharacterized protein LOC108374767 isoform X3 n=1 Tax=Rhagoletis zephyria TaxID=28612 RepID=UPI0008116334|nr:PREDICTED: uncharacterized protein LOC108374767 isoform X3 [Rhagoletis zephyria]